MIRHGLERATEAMQVACAWDIYANPVRMRATGWHLLGTARMGNDPARSVVNAWGRSHDVKNLFIVDGSVFVTSGGVEHHAHDTGRGAVRRRCDEAPPRQPVRLTTP